jgi:hypothetical protein
MEYFVIMHKDEHGGILCLPSTTLAEGKAYIERQHASAKYRVIERNPANGEFRTHYFWPQGWGISAWGGKKFDSSAFRKAS